MTPRLSNASSPDSPVAAVKEALVRDFEFTPDDADIAARDPEIRRFVEEVLEGRRVFADAMARLDRAIRRRREAVGRAG